MPSEGRSAGISPIDREMRNVAVDLGPEVKGEAARALVHGTPDDGGVRGGAHVIGTRNDEWMNPEENSTKSLAKGTRTEHVARTAQSW